jgi:APA family basic amino acid/polyamine antiporter
MSSVQKPGWKTAMAIVVANVIGAGVFASLGFQLEGTSNTWSILLLWSLGAVMALCGAFSYAELGTRMVRSGGEYHFLSKIYHPFVGYLSGWISVTVGFPAAIALAAMIIGGYLEGYIVWPSQLIAIVVVLLLSFLHSLSIKSSSWLQNLTTLFKVLLILIFLAAGFVLVPGESALDWSGGWKREVLMSSFAISFVFVSFSYSGWNAAVYMTDEFAEPRRTIPKALLLGTLIVSVLYVLLHLVFLRQAGLDELKGELEVASIVAQSMWGKKGAVMVSWGIAVLMLSSISAMIWAGSRVTKVMGEDHPLWRWFARKTTHSIPLSAIALQVFIAVILILTGTFEQVLMYSTFVLQLFAALSVAGVIVLRKRKGTGTCYRSPWYPFPQILFLLFSLWILYYLMLEQGRECLFGMGILLLGSISYLINLHLLRRGK